MSIVWKNITLASGLLALATLGAPAFAQSSKSDSASHAQLQAQASSAATSSSKDGPNRWLCASRSSLDIEPVSGDVASQAPAYVVVYRRDGRPVASERIDPATAATITGYDCTNAQAPEKSPLVG